MTAELSYTRIIEIVEDCSERMKCSGESHRMFAKWVSEGINAALRSIPTGGDTETPKSEHVAAGVSLPQMVCVPDTNNPGARIVGFRIREGDEAWGKHGLTEPLSWLEARIQSSLVATAVEGEAEPVDVPDIKLAIFDYLELRDGAMGVVSTDEERSQSAIDIHDAVQSILAKLYPSPVRSEVTEEMVTDEMVENAKAEFRRWTPGIAGYPDHPKWFTCRTDDAGEIEWLREFSDQAAASDDLDNSRLRAALTAAFSSGAR